MKTYNVGVVGYGAMAQYHHNKIVKPDCIKFTAVYDVDPEKCKKATLNGLNHYHSLDDIIKASNIDIILVATPNNFHKDIAVAAMNAGKHVICEKPVALNSCELQEMIKTSELNNVIFTVHQNRRMDKDFQIIKKIYDEGTLDNVFRVESRVQGSRGIADTWRRKKVFGGGMLYDWGVHLIDQLLYMIPSKVISLFAEFQYISQKEVDDNFRLTLQFENGLSALVEIGTCNYIMLPIWYMCGKKGSAQIDYWDLKGRILQLIDNDIRFEDEIPSTLVGPSITLAPRAEDTVKECPLPDVIIDRDIFYRNFVNVLEGREELFVKPQEILRVMNVIDLAFESGKYNKVIECNI